MIEPIFGTQAIEEAHTQLHNSRNTLFQSWRWVGEEIEVLIINTFNGDLYTKRIPKDRINLIEGELTELTRFEITAFLDWYQFSLGTDDILNIGWVCSLNLLDYRSVAVIKRFEI